MKQFLAFLIFVFGIGFSLEAMSYDDYDYPFYDSQCRSRSEANPCPSDDYGFCESNCTSYVAYVLNAVYGIPFNNYYSSIRWSNGGNWDNAAKNVLGDRIVDQYPIPGDVAFWNSGTFGHVAFVEKVHYDSSGNATGIDVTEYNYSKSCSFDERSGKKRLSVDDSDYPDGFIHILAYNEGVTSLHYLDCYEMYTLCDFQTRQEWEWILERVSEYRCRNCDGQYVAEANNFYDAFARGGGSANSGSLPNLKIDKLALYDLRGEVLSEGKSFMQIGKKYKINVWPISKNANCKSGIKKGKDTVETDIFYKISLNESQGDWIYLGRVYTRASTLVKNKSHKEALNFTVPPKAAGYRIYFKAKVDSTAEVKETNEHDNWSDDEWFFEVAIQRPDFIISSLGLKEGTVIKKGRHVHPYCVIRNIGKGTPSVGIRTAYYIDGDYRTDDGSDDKELAPGRDQRESVTSDIIKLGKKGRRTLRVCADYKKAVPESNEKNNCASISFVVK